MRFKIESEVSSTLVREKNSKESTVTKTRYLILLKFGSWESWRENAETESLAGEEYETRKQCKVALFIEVNRRSERISRKKRVRNRKSVKWRNSEHTLSIHKKATQHKGAGSTSVHPLSLSVWGHPDLLALSDSFPSSSTHSSKIPYLLHLVHELFLL